ncbi:LysE family translocator [Gynuella sunshinyii]|uniref:Putative threonine efflux protein n=1 Tax=Gynuella sunshinyii YC6258 TaxID=1445510 RepID=A0A0C5VGL5_9GAMM|nr:LysE family transporter [Gynuella sunshinyii]AJQ92538.1 putative threonine efflux protein [Gynuella sunshinyii YC6258]
MLEVFAYAFSIMYSPGPVNLLAFNAGLQGQIRSMIGFCAGVSTAMLMMFLVFGYSGAWLLGPTAQRYLALLGGAYMIYLAVKLLRANINLANRQGVADKPLHYLDGVWMQLLNPKGLMATLPIGTVQFPAEGISGIHILIWSVLLALFALGAPGGYSVLGAQMHRYIRPVFFRYLNLLMAVLLCYVAIKMVYQQWWG